MDKLNVIFILLCYVVLFLIKLRFFSPEDSLKISHPMTSSSLENLIQSRVVDLLMDLCL